jgi:hypothetical protein
MDQRTKDNWQKVKAALEEAGKTKSLIYQRACAILATGKDPGPGF